MPPHPQKVTTGEMSTMRGSCNFLTLPLVAGGNDLDPVGHDAGTPRKKQRYLRKYVGQMPW